MGKKIVGIVQARIKSERLPAKILSPIGDLPLIEHLVLNILHSKTLDKIVIAVPKNTEPFVRFLERNYPVKIFVGSENDVLERYYSAALHYKADVVVRITADNPFTCPVFLDKAVKWHIRKKADLTHFLGIPLGSGVEVLSFKSLMTTYETAISKFDREHITQFIYRNRNFFRVEEPKFKPDIMSLRVTVDTPVDLWRVSEIYEMLHRNHPVTVYDLLKVAKAVPVAGEIVRAGGVV